MRRSTKTMLNIASQPQRNHAEPQEKQIPTGTGPIVPRFLILGGGAVVSDFYLPALARLGWLSGATIVDLASATLAQIKRLVPGVNTFAGDFRNILADPGLRRNHDAAIVSLPNSLHTAAVQTALKTGYPVLCEKPLALTVADCQLLDSISKQKGVPLAVGMVSRLTPAAKALAAALAAGLIGRVLEVEVDHGGPYAWTSDSGDFFRKENGGILADLGVHYLDWLTS